MRLETGQMDLIILIDTEDLINIGFRQVYNLCLDKTCSYINIYTYIYIHTYMHIMTHNLII